MNRKRRRDRRGGEDRDKDEEIDTKRRDKKMVIER